MYDNVNKLKLRHKDTVVYYKGDRPEFVSIYPLSKSCKCELCAKYYEQMVITEGTEVTVM